MTYVGQPVRRIEDARLVIGNGAFVDDIKLPGMLHAAVLRSIHAHARLRSVDSSAARDLPGVVAVLTGSDIAGVLADIPTREMDAERSPDELNAPEQPPLAWEKVCYVGQPVAIVVAQDPYVARDALELIDVDYQVLPPVLDPHQATQDDAPIIHEALGTNIAMRVHLQGGEVDEAFAQADHVIRQKYQVQRIAPAPLEARGIVAHYKDQGDMLTVWNTTQAPHRVRHILARLLNRSEDSLRVIAPDVGGSFGVKDCIFPEDVLVPYLSVLLRRPVKWVEDRQESLLTYHGRGQSIDLEAAVRKDGVVLGMRVRVVADIGAYFLFTTVSAPFNVCRRIAGPYKIPAISARLLGVITNKTPTGAYRGTGSPEAAFAVERTMDLIAHDLELDPAEVRRRNFVPTDAFPYRTPTGAIYDSGNYLQGLERALELSEYSSWRDKASRVGPQGPLIGIGLATILKSSGASGDHRIESARVTISQSGQISVYTGISPHGQGSDTSFAQIAAEVLGVNPSQVRVLHGDTAMYPYGEGTSASRGLIVGGSAVYAVLQEARQKLEVLACDRLSCPAEDLRFQEGMVFDYKNPDDRVSFQELAAAAYNEELLPEGVTAGLDFSTTYTLTNSPYSYAAHAAVVEVSRDTGKVKILRYVGVHDCGVIVNPMLVEGQLHGGIVQGLGQALTENIIYSEDGQLLSGSFLDYAIPRASDVPELVLDTVDVPSPTNPLGAKGIGSVGTVPAPVVLTNAVLDALSGIGVRHLDTPLTAEKIWQAIKHHSQTPGI
jgi:carbon-monoxide dehydrogenase large subunit